MTSSLRSWSFILVLAASLGFVGCGDDDSGMPPVPRVDGGPGVDSGGPPTRCSPEDDADMDFISAMDEGAGDVDGDGTPNASDTDSDGDGITDRIEGGDNDCTTVPVDSDADGTPDFLDRDSNADGLDDAGQTGDSDGDGVPDWRENDLDGDGISNALERGMGATPVDTDADGIPDLQDLDSDGDTILDETEGGMDLDEDGTPNFRDLDADGDGMSDSLEAGDGELATPPRVCDQEVSPITRTPLNEDGSSYPGDGFSNFIDTDSDNDGLSDGQEQAVGSDPCRFDSDDDGVDDLFEGAYAERNCPGGVPAAGVDPSICQCGARASCTIRSEDFYLVLPYGGAPQTRVLDFSTSIRVADIFFITDTTGSMGGTVDNVKATVTTPGTGLIDRIGATIPDAWFGGGQHDDMPFASWGSSPDEPFILAIRMTPPDMASAVQSAFNGIMMHGGNDGPESQTLALHQIVTGAGGTWTYGGGFGGGATYTMPNYVGMCLDGGWGAPCFRDAALPIVILFTDICSHNGPPGEDSSCEPYSMVTPVLPTWEEAIAAMNVRGAKFIGVNASPGSSCAGPTAPDSLSPCYFLNRTAEETGSVDLDSNPLVYDLPNTASTTVFADTVVSAVETVATRVPLDVDTGVRGEPSLLANAAMYVKRRTPGCRATPAITPCFEAPPGVLDTQAVAFIDTSTFFGVIPGTRVTFQITFQNDFFRGTDRAELFVAFIDVRGGGSDILDTREVYIVVPANPVPFG